MLAPRQGRKARAVLQDFIPHFESGLGYGMTAPDTLWGFPSEGLGEEKKKKPNGISEPCASLGWGEEESGHNS